MSDVGLGATLQLDIAEALSRIDALSAQLAQATSDIPTSLAEPDATPITSAIDAAVAAADTSITPDADASSVTTSIDDAVLAADATVPVDADTTAAAAEIDTLGDGASVDVEVVADTTAAEAAISEVGEDLPELVVDVTAETGTAKADIEAIGDAAEGAADLLGGLTTSTQGFTVANSLAEGSAAGLVETLSGLGGKTAAVTIGIAGTAAVLGTLYSAGLDAVAVGQRFTNQFGALSDELENIDVGTLNGDLGDLALTLGDDDEALKNAAIRVGILGKNSGAAAPEVARTTEQILALSIGLKGANPALGEAGDIASALPAALARGGRALQGFGIDIGAAEIQARALKDTGKATAAELSIYEKSAAGAAIATEKYGDALGAMFQRGADDPQVKIESLKQSFDELIEDLGKPLVEPLTDFLEAIAPLGIAAGEAIGAVLVALTPMIGVLTEVVGPVADFIATIAGFDPALTGFVAALGIAAYGITTFVSAVTTGVTAVNPVLAGFLATIGIVSAAVSFFKIGDAAKTAQEKEFKAAVQGATAALTDQAGTLDLTRTAVTKYLKESSEFAKQDQLGSLARLGISLDDIAMFARNGEKGLVQFTDAYSEAAKRVGFGESFTELYESLAKVQEVLQGTAKSSLLVGVASKDLNAAFLALGDKTGDYVTALDLAQQSQDTLAQTAINAKLATGELTAEQRNAALESTRAADGSLDYSAALKKVTDDQKAAAEAQANFSTAFADLATRFPRVATAYVDLTTKTSDFGGSLVTLAQSLAGVNTTAEDFETIAAGLGVPVENLKAFVEDATTAITDFVKEAEEKIPTIGSAFDLARQKAEAAEHKLTGKDILAGLNETLDSIKAYSTNLREILGSSYADLAGYAAQAGPDVVAAIAESVRDKDGKTLRAIRDGLITGIPQAYADATVAVGEAAPGFIEANGTLGDLSAGAFGDKFAVGAYAAQQLADTQKSIADAPALLQPLLAGLGTSSTAAYQGTLKIADVTTGDITSAGRAISAAHPVLSGWAGALGTTTSGAFGAKSTPGFQQATKDSIAAVQSQVAATGFVAENAAGTAGQKVGKSFSDGIAKGIRDNVRTIADNAAAAVNKAEAAARAAADSHSPSLLFAAVGRDLSLGMAKGIAASSISVSLAAARIVTDAADSAGRASQRTIDQINADINANFRRQREIDHDQGVAPGEGTGPEIAALRAEVGRLRLEAVDVRLGPDATIEQRVDARIERLHDALSDPGGDLALGPAAAREAYIAAAQDDIRRLQAQSAVDVVAAGQASAVGVSTTVDNGVGGITFEAGAITVTVQVTGSVSDVDAQALGLALGDGIIEQVDRRFQTDLRLIRRP